MTDLDLTRAAALKVFAAKLAEADEALAKLPAASDIRVLRTSPGLYLRKEPGGKFQPTSVTAANWFRPEEAERLARELQDPKQPQVRAENLLLRDALRTEVASLRSMIEHFAAKE
jgi:hypothetical protein